MTMFAQAVETVPSPNRYTARAVPHHHGQHLPAQTRDAIAGPREEAFLPVGQRAAEQAVTALQDLAQATLDDDSHPAATASCSPEVSRTLSDILIMLLDHQAQATVEMNRRRPFLGDAEGMTRPLAFLQVATDDERPTPDTA